MTDDFKEPKMTPELAAGLHQQQVSEAKFRVRMAEVILDEAQQGERDNAYYFLVECQENLADLLALD